MGVHSTYDKNIHPKLAYALYKRGFADREVCEDLGIALPTLYKWKEKYPEFCLACDEGKSMPNAIAVQSAFKLCTGYDTEEVTLEPIYEEPKRDKKGHIIKQAGRPKDPTFRIVKMVRKHVDPNAAMLQFWMTNRLKEDWANKQEIGLRGQMNNVNTNLAAELSPEERQKWLEEHGWEKKQPPKSEPEVKHGGKKK